MKKFKTAFIAFTVAGLQLCVAESKEGIVNFANCVTDSKLGKQEQATFEATRKQFYSLLEDTDKQIKELDAKLHDKDILDGLSPEAEQEMQQQLAEKRGEFYQYNQQYNQFLSQGQYQFVQAVITGAAQAAEKIAASKGYTKIGNKEAYLYYAPSLDITADVIKEMDKLFDEEAKKNAKAEITPQAAAPQQAETAKKAAPVAQKEAQKPTAEPEAKKDAANPAKPR
jgi:outer membrane protein